MHNLTIFSSNQPQDRIRAGGRALIINNRGGDGEEQRLLEPGIGKSCGSAGTIATAVADGQVETGLVNHYYVLRLLAEDPDAAAANYFFPEASAGSLVMPSGAGILANADTPEAAAEFVAFLLSVEAQEYFAEETFEYPLVPGTEPFGDLPPLDSIPTPDIDLSDLAPMLDTATDLVAEAGLL